MLVLRCLVVVVLATAVHCSPHTADDWVPHHDAQATKQWPGLMKCTLSRFLRPMQHFGIVMASLSGHRPQQQQITYRYETRGTVSHSGDRNSVPQSEAESAVATGRVMPTRKLLRGKWSQVRGWYNTMVS